MDPYKIHLTCLPKATPRANLLHALSVLERDGFPKVLDVKVFSLNHQPVSSAFVTLEQPISPATCEQWFGTPWAYGQLYCRPAEAKKECPPL
jgi:hypothetical protein